MNMDEFLPHTEGKPSPLKSNLELEWLLELDPSSYSSSKQWASLWVLLQREELFRPGKLRYNYSTLNLDYLKAKLGFINQGNNL